MNIISYNVRGLGRGVKWPAVRRMVNKHHIDMLCIQESKKEVIDRAMCQAGVSVTTWASPSFLFALAALILLLLVPAGET